MQQNFGIHALLFLILCACAQTSGPKLLEEACASPGTVISSEIPNPARGYPYPFRVYLPPCFLESSGLRYPILYLVPGRGGSPETWFTAGVADVVDELILNRETPPFMIVTTETIDTDPHAETIYTELVPYIEDNYPVIQDRQYRAVAGGSLGGIAAYRLLFQYPESFSSAGIFGAGVISGEEAQVREWLENVDAQHIRIFMDTGTEDPLMLERAMVMQSILNEVQIENQLHSDQGGHDYAYWLSNFKLYLTWLTQNW